MNPNQNDVEATGVLGKRKRVYYLCFTQNHDRDLAVKTFIEKFGKQPEETFVEKRVLWLGPVLEK